MKKSLSVLAVFGISCWLLMGFSTREVEDLDSEQTEAVRWFNSLGSGNPQDIIAAGDASTPLWLARAVLVTSASEKVVEHVIKEALKENEKKEGSYGLKLASKQIEEKDFDVTTF